MAFGGQAEGGLETDYGLSGGVEINVSNGRTVPITKTA